jgi:thioredoxin reductase (NADPH)
MENVVIIWSWPAGHTAAIYAARANLKPLMFEWFIAWGVAAGGQLTTTTTIENFPGFPDGIDGTQLMMHMRQQSLNMGTRIETKTVDKVDFQSQPFKIFVGDEIIEAKSVIIATGATAKRMGISGEKEFRQRGISACAICDGGLPMFRNQRIVIIGWGDVAMEEALHLTHFASEVVMLVRKDSLKACKAMQAKVQENTKIKIMYNTEIQEAMWGNFLEKVRIVNNKTNVTSEIECKGLFYAIGHKPNTDFLDGQIELDETGYIITTAWTTKTNIEGVFAAGDVADKKYRQAITSAGTWAMASLEAEEYLSSI